MSNQAENSKYTGPSIDVIIGDDDIASIKIKDNQEQGISEDAYRLIVTIMGFLTDPEVASAFKKDPEFVVQKMKVVLLRNPDKILIDPALIESITVEKRQNINSDKEYGAVLSYRGARL